MARSTRNQKQPDSNRKAKPSIAERALTLLQEPDFFGRVRDAVDRGGLVGEVQNALAIYVIVISSLLERPLNAFVKGASSAGKNFMVSRVTRLFPKSVIKEITSSSETAWNYSGTEFKHKVVYQQEKNDASGPDPVRLLISERELRRIITVREGSEFVKKEFVAEGPIAAISTTTRNCLEVDDETRHLSLRIDESEEQTRRILMRQAEPLTDLSEEEIKIWHEAYQLIAKRASVPIELPTWRKDIIDKVYSGNISVRRYFPAFLEAVRTVALILSFQEHPEDYEPDETIVAKLPEYGIARFIFDGLFTASLNRGDDESEEILNAVQKIASDQDGDPVDAAQLVKFLGISYDKASAKLRAAFKAQLIVLADDKPEKNNNKRYLPNKLTGFVPGPKEVASEILDLKKPVIFFHPVTGKKLTFGGK